MSIGSEKKPRKIYIDPDMAKICRREIKLPAADNAFFIFSSGSNQSLFLLIDVYSGFALDETCDFIYGLLT